MELKSEIKNICNSISVDYNILKDPIDLYKKYGNCKSTNLFKGNIFELFLEELFLGNGYVVKPIGEGGNDGGCDLLVRYPEDYSVRFVVQAKNWKIPIDRYTVKTEFSKFQDNYKKLYNLKNSHFCFIAWKYVRGVKNDLNNRVKINVWDERDIIDKLIKTYDKNHIQKPRIFLYKYQEETYKKIGKYWRENKRCYVEHSTGTGKTYIIAKLVGKLYSKNTKILVLSPSVYINKRIIELLIRIIPVRKIAKRYNEKLSLNILTYQYLFHNSSEIPPGHFTHIIMDEAHRAGAYQWHNKGLLRIITSETKIVGLSATMQRYSSGIDIKEFLGNNCAGKLSVFEAMATGILPLGKYVYSVINLKSKIDEVKDEVNNKYKKYPDKIDSLFKTLDSKQIKDYSIQNIIYKHYGSKKYQKIIAFCEGFEHAIDISALLEKVFIKIGTVKINKITSKGSKKENLNLLDRFSNEQPSKNEVFIIVAIDMLNEGIDVKGIDSVMLFRRTESPRIYFQQIGRALRNKGKEDPLIFDCVQNYQNIDINFINEVQKEIIKYRKTLDDFGFEDIETPKSFSVTDEMCDISSIIKEVEDKLNYYRSYIKAQQAVQKLGVKSESKYRTMYHGDPRLPSKPYNAYKNKGWTNWYDFLGTEIPNLYSSYYEAKKAVQRLGIKSNLEYKKRYKEDSRLPSQPDLKFNNNGWIDWYNFLGTTAPNIYSNYDEAQKAVKLLKIKLYTSYRKRYKEDLRLPSQPNRTYLNKGWIDYNNFLGIKEVTLYPTLEEAKRAVNKLNINSEAEYRKHRKEDIRLPSSPARYYKNKGWIDNYDFFNKNRPDSYLTYNEAKKAVTILSIKTRKEYNKRYDEDPKLPSNPEYVYKGIGWIDYYRYLGTKPPKYYETFDEAKKAVKILGIKSRKEYIEQKRYKEDPKLPSQPSEYYQGKGWVKWDGFIITYYLKYEDAREAAKKLKIKTRVDYIKNKRYKEDPLLPSDPPKKYYSNGWIDWYHFLDTKIPIVHYSYQEAKMIVQKLGIKLMKDYKIQRIQDSKLPCNPSEFYKKKGWKNSDNFLNIKKPDYYATYEEAQQNAQALGIKNRYNYIDRKRYKEDPKLPSSPDKLYYSKGWKNWYSFLGNKPVNIYPTIKEAKQAVKILGIKSGTEYKKHMMYKKDPRLPSSPDKTYKDKGWISFYDFFGIKSSQKYSTYEEAKKAVRKLGIKTRKEYQLLKKYQDDSMLTSSPRRTYKNKGWISWDDFLG